jgi:LacI family transcriptional regulator
MPVHLRDVASRAGVSTATTSRVLSGKGFVSDELRERVLTAVKELNYTPNGLARSMSLRVTHTLGLVVSDVTNPFFTTVARSVEDICQEQGYSVVLCNTDGKPEKERAYLAMLHEKRVDGLLLSSTGAAAEQLRDILDAGIKVVLIDRVIPGVDSICVGVENFDGMFRGTQYLLSLGHRHIGLIVGGLDVPTSQERLDGYLAAMAERNAEIDPALIVDGHFSEEGGRTAGLQLYQRADPPTAIISCNNLMTSGLLFALRDIGKRVPDDVSVLGFDDLPIFSLLDHPLTVIAQPTYELGRRAGEVLLEQLQKGRVEQQAKNIQLPTQLVLRDSCRPVDIHNALG